MLDLYSASAGSGKTYTLAKKYIKYFITISEEKGKERLRTLPELIDSAKHILAVTFTNKATNEMQMRIVNSLYDLAYKEIGYSTDKKGVEYISSPTYMKDFIQELGLSIDEIRKISATALEVLLEHYSDFNVSTIDSFFQKVLRTFAYESEVNDSYQVEIDSELLSQIGVDATLDEIDNNEDDLHTRFWIQTLMDRTESGKWNIFSRSLNQKSKSNAENPYKSFIESVKKMETEQYKMLRDEIEAYFERHKSQEEFRQLYEDWILAYEQPVREAYQRVTGAFKALYDWILGVDLKDEKGDLGRFFSVSRKVVEDKLLQWNKLPDAKKVPGIQLLDHKYLEKGKVAGWMIANPEGALRLRALYTEVADSLQEWYGSLENDEFQHWQLYAANLPFFALFGIVSRKRREYLEEINAIELAETSMILSGVIGQSDAPFVYERLGSRLNHFLIDEFQDTSRMQWNNLSPLLHESMARGNDNLVIGDAKQSIYRFRNADPSIITDIVPQEFKYDIDIKGNNQSENTNFRSLLHIVRFNNSFFRYIAEAIDNNTSDPESSRKKFADLYKNVVQTPSLTEDKGYVEVHLSRYGKDVAAAEAIDRIPGLIDSLIRRGYHQKEICVLVDTNVQATEISKAIIKHNSNLAEGAVKIDFVSEQSLLVSSSQAVKIITGVLSNMAKGTNPKIREGKERLKYGPATADQLSANFRFFCAQHPDKELHECLDMFLDGESNFNVLTELLESMQSLAIPALVEAVTATFVTTELAGEEALYLAAFQDMVLEYCENHPTDIGSFLKWWERKSQKAAVSSPEDTEAVQIMTVHKAKGLEREVAIVPFASWEMFDKMPAQGFGEWFWVKPQVLKHDTIELPPYLPVVTSKLMSRTTHGKLLNEYYDLSKMDRLNKAYVAFTRAKHELYIFSSAAGTFIDKEKSKNDDKKEEGSRKFNEASSITKTLLGNYLHDFFVQLKSENINQDSGECSPLLSGSNVDISDDGLTITVGYKPDRVSFNRKKKQSPIKIEEYLSFAAPKFLKIHEKSLPPFNDIDEEDEEKDLDPRSEGNIKHAVLELVKTPEDLPRAVKHLSLTGVIPYGMASEIETSLADALKNPSVSKWFSPDIKVINERPILQKDHISRRPDRVVVFPDGHVEVIDYKFGKEKLRKYNDQISRYVRLLRQTGKFADVRGYLWYVNENQIIGV